MVNGILFCNTFFIAKTTLWKVALAGSVVFVSHQSARMCLSNDKTLSTLMIAFFEPSTFESHLQNMTKLYCNALQSLTGCEPFHSSSTCTQQATILSLGPPLDSVNHLIFVSLPLPLVSITPRMLHLPLSGPAIFMPQFLASLL